MLQSDALRVQFGFDDAAQLLVLRFSGMSEPEGQIAMLEALAKRIPTGRLRAIFADLSGVTGSTSRGADVFAQNRRAERLTADKPSQLAIALYAPTDITYGMARMYQGFSDPVHTNVEIFECADMAVGWLGLADVLSPDALPETMAELDLDMRVSA